MAETADSAPKAQNLLIVIFDDENLAGAAMKDLQAARSSQKLEIPASAVVRREDDGTLNIKESGDVGAGVGAAAGGALGLLLGALGGKSGAALGAGLGALLGGAAAKYIDVGIPDARLKELGEMLKPGTSAVAALVGEESLEQAKAALAQHGGSHTSEPITVDLAAQFGGGDLGATIAAAVSKAEGALSQAADSTQQVVDQAMSSDLGKQAQDMVSQATDSAKQMVDQAMSSDAAQQVQDAASSAMQQAGDAAQSLGKQASDAAQNLTGGGDPKPSA
jgi:uncharacterized membrane protein